MTHIHEPAMTVGDLITLLDDVDASAPLRVMGGIPAALYWRDKDFETHLVIIEATTPRGV